MSAKVQPYGFDLEMNRKGFGMRAEVRAEVKDLYRSPIIEDLKNSGYQKKWGRVTVSLAKDFGFCYGVDRAVELAYETLKKFPTKRIFLTTEIIHNPTVNSQLRQMGVEFLSGANSTSSIQDIKKTDVVIVPAFGATVKELRELKKTGCTLVDTICGSVLIVWKRVETYAREGFTSIIHGKHYHEETQATSSQVLEQKNGHYLVVLNRTEADYVCEYMAHGGEKAEFYKKFELAMSPGFNPDLHLKKIGLANQTTMLASESLEIAEMFRVVLLKKFGQQQIDAHFMSFDTICSATQERQDAIVGLKTLKPDLILVVGGYNSSNTAHLLKMSQSFAKSFHIFDASGLESAQQIRHKPFGQEDVVELNWLPDGPFALGITSGASTPDKVMGEALERLLLLANS